ncbi:MAG: hypothetical protein LKE29_02880 [Acidaminococcaceae bacterium]|jgi:hypothetical protein|nr:hypothetical protein [Acidaminococcaceae bacterium]
MKKFLALLLGFIFLLALPVSAEKVKFKDKKYEFGKYTKIQLMGIADVQIDKTDFEFDPGAVSKVRMNLLSAFNKKNVSIEEKVPEGAITPKLGFDVKIYVFGNDKIWHDAWVETVNTTKTIYVDEDRNGRKYSKSVSIPVTEYVNHPAGYYYTARVDLEFNVKDLRTDKLVYSIRDTRSRGGESDTSGMLGRICGDFVDDITH